jgi:hypothetical protein
MKKNTLVILFAIVSATVFVSCASSKKGTGCPMTDNIIH